MSEKIKVRQEVLRKIREKRWKYERERKNTEKNRYLEVGFEVVDVKLAL